jgi:L-Ala-D/L-Glu epimerase
VKLSHQVVDLRLALPWAIARTTEPGGLRRSQVVHVILHDEVQGVTGHGEAAPISRYGESVASVEAFLERVDAALLSLDEYERSAALIEAIAPGELAAKCAVEMALLDAAAKRAGQPVWELLQLPPPGARAISYTIGIGSVQQVREQVRRGEPFPVLKLKLGGPDDRAAFHALRELAPTKTVWVDANEGWRDREQALRMIEWLARDPHVELIEQPLPAGQPEADHRWLFERSPLPVLADESCHRSAEVARVVGCFHGINVKLMKTGGLLEAKRTLRRARALGLRTMLGCMIESSLGIAAAFHLAGLADYLDLDSHLLLANDPFTGLTLHDGALQFAAASPMPGLGVAPVK